MFVRLLCMLPAGLQLTINIIMGLQVKLASVVSSSAVLSTCWQSFDNQRSAQYSLLTTVKAAVLPAVSQVESMSLHFMYSTVGTILFAAASSLGVKFWCDTVSSQYNNPANHMSITYGRAA